MATFTNRTKDTASYSNVNVTGYALWGDPVATWGDSIFTWGANITTYTNATKDSSSFTNQTKN